MNSALFIASREMLHFRLSSIGQIALATVLIFPLLLMLAIERGVVTDLRSYLETSPESLRLNLTTSQSLSNDWFEEISKDPRVGFIAPHPYENATQIDAIAANGRKQNAALLASGSNDPFLPNMIDAPADNETLLTAIMAANLDAAVGDTIHFQIECENFTEPLSYEARITGIVDRRAWSTTGALVSERFLTELFLCKNYASDLFGNPGPDAPSKIIYPQFRLFARSLADVRPLTESLAESDILVNGQFANADLADSIERTAESIIIAMILAVGIGAGLALAASLLADARRMRPDLATLRIDGLTLSEAFQTISIKALIITAFGSIIGVTGFLLVSRQLNIWIAQNPLPFDTTVRLDWGTVSLVILLSYAVSLIASVWAISRSFSKSPWEDQIAT